MEHSIPGNTSITINYGDGQLTGIARYCLYRDLGYFVGVEFSDLPLVDAALSPQASARSTGTCLNRL